MVTSDAGNNRLVSLAQWRTQKCFMGRAGRSFSAVVLKLYCTVIPN